MGKTILITGGSRSGKSAFAQQKAERIDGSRLFIATCPVLDDEMAKRIRRHMQDRQHSGFETIEEQLDIAGQLKAAESYNVILVDCLTLWINNLMYAAEMNSSEMNEDLVAVKSSELVAAAKDCPGVTIFVTNEVGLGVVPESEAGRLYRDLVGRCNQNVAAACDSVYLVSCGIPIQLKGIDDAL